MKQRGVKFSDEMWEQIQAEAKRSGISAGEFIRSAVGVRIERDGGRGSALVKVLHEATTQTEGGEQRAKPVDVAKVREQVQRIAPEPPRMRCPMFGCREFRPCPTHAEFK